MDTTLPLQSNTLRVHGLDTLRSIAILAVIAYHLFAFHGAETLPHVLLPVVRLGWMGVDLFFVLSGYLIASQLLRPYLSGERPNLLLFYRNRLYRVLPVFFVVLTLYFLLPFWTENPLLAPIWQYATFTFNLFSPGGGFSHAWSLCVEEHFYLFLPLIVIFAMRKPRPRQAAILISGFVLFGVAIRGFFLFHLLRPLAAAQDDRFGPAYMWRIYYPTYSRLDGLLAGVTLAVIKTFRPIWWGWVRRHGHLLSVLGVVLVGAAINLFEDRFPAMTGDSISSTVFGFPLLAWGLACLVASALSTNGLLRLKVPGAQLCATLAYSLYLTHKEIIHLVDDHFPRVTQAGMYPWLGVYAMCCLVVAATLYLCVERPFLRLRDRCSKAQRPMGSVIDIGACSERRDSGV